jgi:methyl halide transferase
MTAANIDRDWEDKYREGNTPWDSGLASKELQRALSEHSIAPGRALELGCGTGTNAVFLAQQGFDVTAVDCSSLALEQAREKAVDAGVRVNWIEADVQNFGAGLQPFEFVFDRGCYHCCRRVDLLGYLQTLENVTAPGTRYLSLCGNANEQTEGQGPPRVTEQEIRDELGGLFAIDPIREFRFEDPGGVEGPLGWSVLMTRK